MRWYDRFWRVLILCSLPLVLINPDAVMIVMTVTLIPSLLVGIGMEVALRFSRERSQMNLGAGLVWFALCIALFWIFRRDASASNYVPIACIILLWLILLWAQVVWWHAQRRAKRYPQGKPPLRLWASCVFALISAYVLGASLVGWLMDTPKQTLVSSRGQELTIRYFRPAAEPLPKIRFVLPDDVVKKNEAFFESLVKETEKHGVDIRAVVNGQECRLNNVGSQYPAEFELYRWENKQHSCGWQLPAGFTDIKLRIVNLPEPLLNQAIEWDIEYPMSFKYVQSGVVYAWLRPMVVFAPIGLILWLIYFLWFVCRKLNK